MCPHSSAVSVVNKDIENENLLHCYSFFLTAFIKVPAAEVSHLQLYSGPSLSQLPMSGPVFQWT